MQQSITNSTDPLKVLITRPTKKSQALTLLLKEQGIACISQPLFDYQPLAEYERSQKLLTIADILIFVSVAAVEFAHANVVSTHWQFQHIIAVGKATKAALQALGFTQVLCPSQENSEGVLGLNVLNRDLLHTTITIVRGNGGREHLARELVNRNAKVQYLESYQRIWRTFPKDIDKQWYQQQINCIVVTSNALLEKLVYLTQATNKLKDTDTATRYWRNDCLWLVVSKRIADHAQQLGLVKVMQCDGANEQAISTSLQLLIEKNIK